MSFFIALEGIEGSGKTTQASLLARWLEKNQIPVVQTREPGGCPIADQIRSTLLNPEHESMAADTELLLYAAARAQHVAEVIRPALEQDRVVLCDRFTAATLAYQGYGRGLDLDLIARMNQLATGPTTPDLTLLLDFPVDAGVSRARSRNSATAGDHEGRFEAESLVFHQRVRDGYLELAKKDQSMLVIPATGSVADVQQRLRQALSPYFPAVKAMP
jgi:dTMP kinase